MSAARLPPRRASPAYPAPPAAAAGPSSRRYGTPGGGYFREGTGEWGVFGGFFFFFFFPNGAPRRLEKSGPTPEELAGRQGKSTYLAPPGLGMRAALRRRERAGGGAAAEPHQLPLVCTRREAAGSGGAARLHPPGGSGKKRAPLAFPLRRRHVTSSGVVGGGDPFPAAASPAPRGAAWRMPERGGCAMAPAPLLRRETEPERAAAPGKGARGSPVP